MLRACLKIGNLSRPLFGVRSFRRLATFRSPVRPRTPGPIPRPTRPIAAAAEPSATSSSAGTRPTTS